MTRFAAARRDAPRTLGVVDARCYAEPSPAIGLFVILASFLLHTFALAASPADFVRFPPGVTSQGLLELTEKGEVWFLPAHGRVPFRGVVATRAAGPCTKMEAAMLDVEGYKDRWPMKEVIVLERTPSRVRYRLKLDLAFAPLIEGEVEKKGGGRVLFRDPETDARSLWTLSDTGSGCLGTFSIAESKDSPAAFVAVARAVEESSGDSTNLAAAVASVRGYTKAESVKGGPSGGAAAEAALHAIADEGTAIRIERAPGRFPRFRLVRRVAAAPDRVLWAIRDRLRYPERTDVVDKVDDRGRTAKYRFGFFGGRATITNRVVEEGAVDAPGGLRVVETVQDGDVSSGGWTWIVKAIEGGTHVELLFDLDVVPGSSVLSAVAREDAGFAEGMALQIAGGLVGHVVGGKPVGRRPVVPVAAAETTPSAARAE